MIRRRGLVLRNERGRYIRGFYNDDPNIPGIVIWLSKKTKCYVFITEPGTGKDLSSVNLKQGDRVWITHQGIHEVFLLSLL